MKDVSEAIISIILNYKGQDAIVKFNELHDAAKTDLEKRLIKRAIVNYKKNHMKKD
jgi:hypothetical protein